MTASRGFVLFAVAIALVHLLLAVMYARVAPYRTGGMIMHQRDAQNPSLPARTNEIGAPDERQHANYVQHLLDGKGIPVFRVQVPDPSNPGQMMRNPDLGETYQAHQPPLYYLVSAGYLNLLGKTDLERPDAGLTLRYLNGLIGALTVLGVFYLCLWGFGNGGLGLVAASIAGFMPMMAALSGAISNDPLLFLLCTWTLALCARGIREGWTVKGAALAGLLVGLGLLTKTTALALLPTLALAIYLGRKAEMPRSVWFVAAGVPLLIGGGWWIRNAMVLPGFDPLAMTAFTDAFIGSPQAQVFIDAFGGYGYWIDMVGWWTARSFFGAFGIMDIFLEPVTYRVLIFLALLLFAGWQLSLRQEEWRQHNQVQILNGVFLVLIIILFQRFNAQYFQGQARYLYPAIGVISTGFAIGALFYLRKWPIALAVISLCLLGLNIYVLGWLPGEFELRSLS